MNKIQSCFLAIAIAAISVEANCGITRFEFDAVVTFVAFQQNMPQTISVGDIISGHVDMNPDIAPPHSLGSYPIRPATQDWIEAEVSISGSKYSTVDLVGTNGAVFISDTYPSSTDLYSHTLVFQGGNEYFEFITDDIKTQKMPSLPNFITGVSLEQNFTWNLEPSNNNPPTGGFEYYADRFDPFTPAVWLQFSFQRIEVGQIAPTTPVDLSGTIKTVDGTDICAMVLASGQYTFSCNPIGAFSLTGLPRENDGTVKRQIYAQGFFPKIDILTDSTNDVVTMTRSGSCPSYNTPYDPAFAPGSSGKRINISGKVLLQNSQTPICAMVLANGQYMFSCDGTGSYNLNIPLDNNGQYKLQVYAQGFAPTIQRFDEFSSVNNVRMARAAECQ